MQLLNLLFVLGLCLVVIVWVSGCTWGVNHFCIHLVGVYFYLPFLLVLMCLPEVDLHLTSLGRKFVFYCRNYLRRLVTWNDILYTMIEVADRRYHPSLAESWFLVTFMSWSGLQKFFCLGYCWSSLFTTTRCASCCEAV